MEESIKDASKLSVKQLHALLKTKHITMKGNKAELFARVVQEIKRDHLEHFYGDQVNNDNLLDPDETVYHDLQDNDAELNDDQLQEDEVNDAEVNDDAVGEGAAAIVLNGSVLTFKDVEESLQRFSGDRKQNLQKWITDFEETAVILKWSKIQQLVYAKRLLTGAAKMFINVEASVKSYAQLIQCLQSEFGQKLSSVKIHKQLMETKKLQAETYREYLYRMMGIAEQANIEIDSTIQYVIENIVFSRITTGVPRANGQVEGLNSIVIAVLTKLSVDNPMTWYKHVDRVQRCINSTYQRSIGTSPFQLMFGTPMRQVEDILLTEWLQDDIIDDFCDQRDVLHCAAKQQILKIQDENKKGFNKRRKDAHVYKVNDLVAIKRTPFGPGLKLRGKFLGPYRVTKVKGMERYDVLRVGDHEGPGTTNTCAEYMKPWSTSGIVEVSSGSDESQDGRM